jgi:hypothetical protein
MSSPQQTPTRPVRRPPPKPHAKPLPKPPPSIAPTSASPVASWSVPPRVPYANAQHAAASDDDVPPPRAAPALPGLVGTPPLTAADPQRQQQRRVLHRRSRSFNGRSASAAALVNGGAGMPSTLGAPLANSSALYTAQYSASPVPRRPSRPPMLAAQSSSPFAPVVATSSLATHTRPPGVLSGWCSLVWCGQNLLFEGFVFLW